MFQSANLLTFAQRFAPEVFVGESSPIDHVSDHRGWRREFGDR